MGSSSHGPSLHLQAQCSPRLPIPTNAAEQCHCSIKGENTEARRTFAYSKAMNGQGRIQTQPAPPSLRYFFISDSVIGKVCPGVAGWGLLLQTAEPVASLCAHLLTGHCRNTTVYQEKPKSRLLSHKWTGKERCGKGGHFRKQRLGQLATGQLSLTESGKVVRKREFQISILQRVQLAFREGRGAQ